jgi:hypothetical protein
MVKGIAPPEQLYVKEKLVHYRKFIAQNDTNPTDPSSPLHIVALRVKGADSTEALAYNTVHVNPYFPFSGRL